MDAPQPLPAPRTASTVFTGLALAILTCVAFAGVGGHDFVDIDDPDYVSRNPHVLTGITRDNLAWAFTAFHAHNWHPLTWLSLQLDAQLFGSSPRAYHLTNLLLHVASSLLLLGVLVRMTGALGRSAVVAALFAVHPLHVESVAWVAERKDVLSALFWMLVLWAYVGYAARPGVGRYLLVCLAFVLGLMAKPMLVTLPCVLLLLDYWPLRRLRWLRQDPAGGTAAAAAPASPRYAPASVGRLVAEKAPLLVLVIVCSLLTMAAQQDIVKSTQEVPVSARISNALVASIGYLAQAAWPDRLACFYPHQGSHLPPWQVAGAAFLLAGISALCLWNARRRPYLPVGWFWYLGTLVPVIGLVQVGLHAHADRYTYVPLIGIFLGLAWAVADLAARWRVRNAVLATAALVLVLGYAVRTWVQVGYWRNSTALWQHALDVTTDNATAHFCLGRNLQDAGQLQRAVDHFEAALVLNPPFKPARDSLAATLLRLNRPREAIDVYREGLRLVPDWAEGHQQLGGVFLRVGDLQQAVRHLTRAVRLRPDLAIARYNLGLVLARRGSLKEATEHLTTAVRLMPDHAEAHHQLARVLRQQGQLEEALASERRAVDLAPEETRYRCHLGQVLQERGRTADAARHYRLALDLDPHWPRAFQRLAWICATHPDSRFRDAALASELIQQALQAAGSPDAEFLDTLAAAHAEAGHFDKAVAAATEAISAAATAEPERVPALRARLRLYQGHQPYRDDPPYPNP
jgi:tetratricopeptide (TPR) repeat protein